MKRILLIAVMAGSLSMQAETELDENSCEYRFDESLK